MINQADSLKDFPGLLDCVHCGLCLDSCPTYKVSGSEADSPRGRLALLRAVQEGRLKDEEAADPLERCLLCRACEPACPSQVPYHEAWSHWQNQRGPAAASRLLATLATPWRLRLLGVAARLAKSLGILRITERWAPRGLARRAGSIPSHPSRWRPEKTIKPAHKQLRGRIGLHIGCVNGEFFGATLRNLTSLLNAQGFEIVIPHQPTCCGALHGHSGAGTEGRSLANETLKSFSDDLDAILSPSAGCVGWLNEIQSGKIREPMAFL
ncbi:MAG TPA: hypothetical protein DDW23_06480, partial [Planctomycetes bacterium]|nr:hypothetical protein [Planctomycetota bacterium]